MGPFKPDTPHLGLDTDEGGAPMQAAVDFLVYTRHPQPHKVED